MFDLYSQTTTHQQKVDSFLSLKDMAGANYQNRFQIEENDEGVRYNLDLSDEQCPGFSLSFRKLPVNQETLRQELNRSDYWSHNGVGPARDQVKADICRASYTVSGTPLPDGTPDERMKHFDDALTASDPPAIVPGGQNVRYDVRMVEGEVHVRAVCIKDIDMVEPGRQVDLEQRQGKLNMILSDGDHPFYKSQEMRLDLRIMDGDPRAMIDIAGVRHLASRDVDTVQVQ
jgi:hypothetical protein